MLRDRFRSPSGADDDRRAGASVGLIRRQSILQRPISLRTLAWLGVAVVLVGSVIGALPDLQPMLALLAGAAIVGVLVIGLGRRSVAGQTDHERVTDPDELSFRVDDLETRAIDAIALEQRIADLENRLDFAERLLTEQRGNHLPPPSDRSA